MISVPIENDMIPLSQIMPIQYSATSNHEYYGTTVPDVTALLRGGKYDAAAEIYWATHAARKANGAIQQKLNGGYFIDRMAWKFQGWLQGFNGGPLRLPTQRIHDADMFALRQGLLDSDLNPCMDPFREFFVGRNPA